MSEPDMVYEDQSASALRLTLAVGELDTNQFSIVARDFKVFNPRLHVEAAIIGASHYVTFRLPGLTIHEVFACVDAHAPSVLASIRPWPNTSGAISHKFTSAPRCQYTMTPDLQSWVDGAAELERLERMIKKEANKPDRIGLVFAFPKGNLAEEPKTLVLVQYFATLSRVQVDTAHAYPNEGSIAFTRSELHLGDR